MNDTQFTRFALITVALVLTIVLCAVCAGTPLILALLGAPLLVAGLSALAVRSARRVPGQTVDSSGRPCKGSGRIVH